MPGLESLPLRNSCRIVLYMRRRVAEPYHLKSLYQSSLFLIETERNLISDDLERVVTPFCIGSCIIPGYSCLGVVVVVLCLLLPCGFLLLTSITRCTGSGQRRIVYTIKEYSPLLDSSNMDMDDWVLITQDIKHYYQHFDG